MIQLRTRVRFNQSQVQKKVQAANFRSLGHAAGTIRLTAKRSIRKRKKPSSPGSPPHTQTGMLRRVIRYEVNRDREEAVIGPVNEIAGRLWNLHEFGGVSTKRRKLKRHRFRVGQHGPIRVIRPGKFAHTKLLTGAQANRATRLIEAENERRGASKPRRYPKRPFMRPALEANQSRLPKFWRDSVK